ncbi:dinitrogenase iron-molybdenum cofactor biosynthesis protein [bacterium]|nr:dinitrogenase iron-molybdenum cofactor biosynthesis protein [bacterium]
MKKTIAAIATDDGETFIDRHFGDADYFNCYEISETEARFIHRIVNTTEEESNIHADPKKAHGVTKLLKDHQVQVVVSKIFGPNIKKIRKKFVCILMNDPHISDSIQTIQKNFISIIEELQKGEERTHLNYKIKNIHEEKND